MELVTEKLPTKTVGNFLLKHCFILKRDDIDFQQKSISLFNISKILEGLSITMQNGSSDIDILLRVNVELLNDKILYMAKNKVIYNEIVDDMIENIKVMFFS